MSEIKYQNPVKQLRFQSAMERQAQRDKRTPEQQLERLSLAPGESKRERTRLLAQIAQKNQSAKKSKETGETQPEKKTRKSKKIEKGHIRD